MEQFDQKFDVFLSHNSREKPVVEELSFKLRAEGLSPWLDKEQLIPGKRWQGGLAGGLRASATCAVFIGKDDIGNWESEELDVAQNRAANDHEFRLIPVLLPGLPIPFDPSALPVFLLSRTWVDLRGGLDDEKSFHRLVSAIRGLPPCPDGGFQVDQGSDLIPYLGLNTFDEADAKLFFGRDPDIQRLIEKLKGANFLAVLGASGSGKSSLVRAGLIPALRRGGLPGSKEWMIRVFKPGARPLAELALQLAQLRGEEQRVGALTELEKDLREDERALHNAVRLRLASLRLKPEDEGQRRVLIVIDQFEEIFTLCRDDDERARFLNNLLYASAALDSRTVIVLTMRADFYYKCAVHSGLAARIAAHQYLVGPMTEENLRRAIEQPAQLAGLRVEPTLMAEVLAELSQQPGSLPLMEHALLEVWKRHAPSAGMLTLRAYLESGGVKGALAKRAEETYESMSHREKEIVRHVMLRLTQPGDGTDDTRRRAKLSELVTSGDESAAVEEVVKKFADERLLTTNREDQTEDQVVDVSHEALIRGWPRLRKWVDEDRVGLRTLFRINEAALEWARENRDEGLLFRGARLAIALEWRTGNEPRLNDLEREFLSKSDALRVQEEEEEKAAQQRELKAAQTLAETERRSRKKQQSFLIILAVLLLASVIITVFAFNQRREIQAESQRNEELLYVANMKVMFQASERGDAHEVRRILDLYLDPTKSDLRRFDWFLYWKMYHNENDTLKLHSGLVRSVAFGADGRKFASGSDDKTVKLWDAQSNKEIITLKGHSDNVRSVAFSPDGKTLASGSDDKTVKLWDVQANKEMVTLTGHNDRVTSVAFSADGKVLASGSEDRTVKLWDVQANKEIITLKGHNGPVTSVAFSPDGKVLASGSEDRTAKLWGVQTRQEIVTLTGHDRRVTSIAFSPDGKTLASGSDDKTVKLWDVQTNKEMMTLIGHIGSVASLAFSPDGKTVASGSDDNNVKLWDVQANKEMITLKGHDGYVASVAFSPDGQMLASGSEDQTVKLWGVQTNKEMITLKGHDRSITSVAFSADAKMLASGSEDGSVKIWGIQANKEMITLKGHDGRVTSIAFSTDGKVLASGSEDKTVKLWDAQANKEIISLKGHAGRVTSIAFSPDGRVLASGSEDRTVKLWDVQTRQEIIALIGHEGSVASIAFSPDGKVLASGSDDKTVKLWDVQSNKEIITLKGHSDNVRSVAFNASGRVLASGSYDKTVKLWDVQTRDEIVTFNGHDGFVRSVAFNAGGKVLASGSEDNTVKLWDVQTRQEIITLLEHDDLVTSVAFSSDGKMLASGSEDKMVRLWIGTDPKNEKVKAGAGGARN
jgi:WD40 repeat protein